MSRADGPLHHHAQGSSSTMVPKALQDHQGLSGTLQTVPNKQHHLCGQCHKWAIHSHVRPLGRLIRKTIQVDSCTGALLFHPCLSSRGPMSSALSPGEEARRWAAIFWPAAPQHQAESLGAHWSLLDTTRDCQRPLETNRDHWRPSETARGRQRSPEAAGHHQTLLEPLGLPWSATQVTGAWRWHFVTLRMTKPLGGGCPQLASSRLSYQMGG